MKPAHPDKIWFQGFVWGIATILVTFILVGVAIEVTAWVQK